MCVSSFWCCCRISWFDVMPSFFFCHCFGLRAFSFCLGVSWYRIACICMALFFSDSHLFAVCVMLLFVLLSMILLWLDTPFIFCHISVLRAFCLSLAMVGFRIACICMALIFSDSHLFAVCVMVALVLLSIILLWLDTHFLPTGWGTTIL